MACSVSPILSGSFGSCFVDIEESNFNKDSTFWYIENENSVYNFKLTLCPYLSATPLKIFYPVVEVIDVKSFQKTLAFPPFNQYLPSTYNSLLDFSFCNQENGAEYNIVSIDEPVVSFNSVDNIFDFSFIGRFREGINAFTIFNYRFQKNNQILNPYSVNVYSPNQLIFSTNFADGYLSPLLDIQTYPKSVGPYLYPQPNLDYSTCPVEGYPCPYTPPCQNITVAHDLENKTLKFNSNSFNSLSTYAHNVTFLNYVSGLDPSKDITIIFDAAAYYYENWDDFLITNNNGNICNARTVGEHVSDGPGEGFCVYFYQLTSYKDFIGSGPNSCFGYAPGSAVLVDETNGYYLNFNQGMYGGYAGVGFDIGGEFGTYADGKAVNGVPGPYYSRPNSITIRAGQYENFKVLQTTDNINHHGVVLAQAISALEDIKFNTYRVILDENANRIRVGVLDCITNEFIDICCEELDYQIDCDQYPSILFTGLSFSTGSKICHFEIKNYSVVGKSLVPEAGDACGRTHINTPTPTCPLVFITNTPTPTSSETPTHTPTPTKTTTPTPTVSRTPQKSATPTGTPTPTPTITVTPTLTPTKTVTPTVTPSPTTGNIPASPTPTTTVTPTVTPSSTPPKAGGKILCIYTPTDNGIYLQSWNACRAYMKRELDAQLPPVNGAYSDIWKILQYINFRLPIVQNIGTQAAGVNTWGGFGTTRQSYYVTFTNLTSNARNPSYIGTGYVRSNLDNSIIAEIPIEYSFTGEPPKNFNTFYEGENNITWCPLYINQIIVS